jgi:hypothetical protein
VAIAGRIGTLMPAGPLRGGPRPPRFSVGFFPDVFVQAALGREVSWEALVVRLSRFPIQSEATDKRRLPCWAPTQIRPATACTAPGIEALSLLVLDIDSGIGIADALDRCAPFTVAAHTSWSHRPGQPRFRLVLPLAQPIPVERWKSAWSIAVEALGLPADPKCCNANRRYLLPARSGPSAAHEAHAHTTALALDLLPLLPAAEAHAQLHPPLRTLAVPHHRAERATRRRLATEPEARRQLADALGAQVRGDGPGERADHVHCPNCGRPSVWFLLAPERASRARCRHLNSCGWTGPVTDLALWAA